ncbi:50S ribosomal protein L1 [Candidatus Woesearchaeota archaeon]|nr:50S ribosomal protein L1 [Candidatus Woesearchaeota archaeon]
MEKQDIITAITELRQKSPKRNFLQTIDFVANLQGLDIKKPEHKVDFALPLPHKLSKKTKICAFVDSQLTAQAKPLFDTVITKEEFPKWAADKRNQKKLAKTHRLFVAQMEVMAQVAATFGKVLGPRGKMPNPKAGGVFPGAAQLQPLMKRWENLARLQTKNELVIKTPVGDEKMSDDQIAENVMAVYNTLISKLPQEKNNIRNTLLKFTMGPIFKIGEGWKKQSMKKEAQ